MTKFLLTTALSGLIVFSAYSANASETPNAQMPRAPQQMQPNGARPVARQFRAPQQTGDFLNLTDEQKAKISEFREQTRQEMEPLVREMNAIRGKLDSIRAADMKVVESLLTPEQKARLDKDGFLNLTDEQKAKAQENREKSRQETEPLLKKMDELNEKMDKVREADRQKFEAVLTPEQKTKLEEVKQQREKMHMNGGRPGLMPQRR